MDRMAVRNSRSSFCDRQSSISGLRRVGWKGIDISCAAGGFKRPANDPESKKAE
jgi:hypothetical protein